MKNRNKKINTIPAFERAFTLIELLMVISIIALLSTIVLSSVRDSRQKALDAKAVADLHQVEIALNLYGQDHGNLFSNLALADEGPLNAYRMDDNNSFWIKKVEAAGSSNVLRYNNLVDDLVPKYIAALPQDSRCTSNEKYCYKFYSTSETATVYTSLSQQIISGGGLNGAHQQFGVIVGKNDYASVSNLCSYIGAVDINNLFPVLSNQPSLAACTSPSNSLNNSVGIIEGVSKGRLKYDFVLDGGAGGGY